MGKFINSTCIGKERTTERTAKTTTS